MKKTDDEAQTSIDFLLGVSIFAVTLLFVLQMATTSVVTFTPSSQTQEATAERAGALLYNDLSDGNGITTLSQVNNFFNQTHSGIENDLGIGSNYDVNVTVRDSSGNTFRKTGPDGELPETITSGISASKRVIRIDDGSSQNAYEFEVQVWSG